MRKFQPFYRKHDNPIKVFHRGARHYLHPKLSFLDSIDCELYLIKPEKVIVVNYDPSMDRVEYTDYIKKVYRKTVISSTVDFIVEVIHKDFINHQPEEVGEQ